MRRAITVVRGIDLDVAIVSYAAPDPALVRLAAKFDSERERGSETPE